MQPRVLRMQPELLTLGKDLRISLGISLAHERIYAGRNHRYGPGLVCIPRPPVSRQQTHPSSLP